MRNEKKKVMDLDIEDTDCINGGSSIQTSGTFYMAP
jgi:hypothetical protein